MNNEQMRPITEMAVVKQKATYTGCQHFCFRCTRRQCAICSLPCREEGDEKPAGKELRALSGRLDFMLF